MLHGRTGVRRYKRLGVTRVLSISAGLAATLSGSCFSADAVQSLELDLRYFAARTNRGFAAWPRTRRLNHASREAQAIEEYNALFGLLSSMVSCPGPRVNFVKCQADSL